MVSGNTHINTHTNTHTHTGKGEASGWELLESEYEKWEAMRSEVRDQVK